MFKDLVAFYSALCNKGTHEIYFVFMFYSVDVINVITFEAHVKYSFVCRQRVTFLILKNIDLGAK
jgi:hypothetical protein